MKLLPLFCVAASMALVTGCTTTTIVPQIGNIYTVSAIDATENAATDTTINKAKAICDSHDSIVKIIDQETTYLAADATQKTLITLANKVLPNDKTKNPYTPNDHTYKTTLSFRCEDKERD
jgi:hypothetical protein